MGFRDKLRLLLKRELTDNEHELRALNNELASAIGRAGFAISNTHSVEKMRDLEKLKDQLTAKRREVYKNLSVFGPRIEK